MSSPGAQASGGEPEGERLPATHRLHSRAEIKQVQDGGQRFASGALLLMLLPNPLGYRRLGVTVSSRVGNSVVRNSIKRWFREIFRKRRALLPPSVDVVMIARASAAQASLAQLTVDFEKASEQARLRQDRNGGRSAGAPPAAKPKTRPGERDGR